MGFIMKFHSEFFCVIKWERENSFGPFQKGATNIENETHCFHAFVFCLLKNVIIFHLIYHHFLFSTCSQIGLKKSNKEMQFEFY